MSVWEETDEEVWFSPSKLERIMYNLLSNAFKYTQPGDYVKLSAKLLKKIRNISSKYQ
ncbi:ATP-binding protein [Bacteroides thetaiotaomicron]|nr:ATP-binding protein [Bacteroides thetaiotaomicron]